MKGNKVIEAIVIGACLAAISASGAAIVKVARLDERSLNHLEVLKDIKEEIRALRSDMRK